MSRVTLITDRETEDKFAFDEEETARKVIGQVLLTEGCPMDVEVSLSLVMDDAIHEMNRQFRGIDRPTDVLSFPNLTFETPSDFSAAKADPSDCCDPETGDLVLGDIVINTRRVISQAREYGHSQLREFAFLVAHSTLHLCGYDHMTPDEAKVMEEKQEAALKALHITRED